MMGEAECRAANMPPMTSRSGASAASVSVSVASAVLRLSPARPRQAPVRKWVMGSKWFEEFYFAGQRSATGWRKRLSEVNLTQDYE